MTQRDLPDFARSWAKELGYELFVTYDAGVSGLADVRQSVLGRSHVAHLFLDDRIHLLSRASQETVIAHEMGHLATPRTLFRGAILGLTVSLLAVFATFLFGTPVGTLIAALPVFPFLCAAFAGLRRSELQADQWAARQGYPYTHEHVAALELAGLNEPQCASGVGRLWESRPSVDERVAYTSRYL